MCKASSALALFLFCGCAVLDGTATSDGAEEERCPGGEADCDLSDCGSAGARLCERRRGCGGSAAYRVVFDASWDPSDVRFPHFSPLIGGTHDASVSLWRLGELATVGIQTMAETGEPGVLAGEVRHLIDEGSAGAVVRGGGIERSPGSSFAEFRVDEFHPLVSVTSMVAPSPDWFVGVDSLSLCLDGDWVDEFVVQLPVQDAGTDSGPEFTSRDQPTVPPAPVSQETPFLVEDQAASVGTMTFVRR